MSPAVELRPAESDAELMLKAFTRTGGLEPGDTVAQRLRDHHVAQPISVLARWIVARRVIVMAWRSQAMIPMFQFARHDLSLRAEVVAAVAVLAPRLDDWNVALWFARAHPMLDGAAPVDALDHDPEQVLRAAMAQRCASHH